MSETNGTEEKYLVWSNEHSSWWGPKRSGYTWLIENAGRYTRDEALRICKGARGGREYNANPSELPVQERDACAFWTNEGLEEQQQHERERRQREEDDDTDYREWA